MINQDRIVSTFIQMVKIDSPSFREKEMADFLANRMKAKGYEVKIDSAGDSCGGDTGNVIVRVPATGDGEPVGFSAHMDCVPPCEGIEPVINDGVITSAGETVLGGDDKAGIAAILEALEHIEEENIPHRELYFAFTIAEEAGMHGAKNLDPADLPVKELVILDSGGPIGTMVSAAPTKAGVTMTFHGKAAHAGMVPEEGISAIQMAADAVTRMNLLRIDAETTANLGRIEGGGATNIVTDTVTLTAEARSLRDGKLAEQLEHMKKCCEEAAEKFGGSVDFEAEVSYPALHMPADSPLMQKAIAICEKLGFRPDPKETGGGSDANIHFGKGYDALNIGINMQKVHTTDEFIRVSDMVDSARFVAEFMKSE